ncbi:MAG: 6-phosphogluconolactonase [Planctomycetota bacterium]
MSAGRVVICADEEDLARRAAAWIARRIARAVEARGRCTLALSGGSTPRPVYEELARSGAAGTVQWNAVDLYVGDERCVPLDDPQSNSRMIAESLAPAIAAGARLHRMQAAPEDRDAAAADYAACLPEALDILLLGVGEDGHTASLFPGSPALDEQAQRVVAVKGPRPPLWRLTITPRVIASAREIAVLVTGRAKAGAVARALAETGSIRDVPARLARRGTWFLDAAAAGELARARPT